ncbi:MAG: adenylate/guanylate cyclase domain-containing protein [Gammaproteobacteria bacterium]|nr:adenylate/guanylate cyclase domain-containing protein [Gammaproteobacteria bacterium]
MPISQRTASALRICIGTAMAGAAIGASYSAMLGGQPKLGATVGFLIGSGVSALELFIVQRRIGEPLRRMKLAYFIGIMTVLWMLIIAIGLQVTPHLYGMSEGLYPKAWTGSTLWQDIAFSLAVAFLLNFFGRIRSLVGSRVLFNFLLGRYHRPLREERVFLFLDLAHSTMLSEKLGDICVQSLIGRFFFDIAQPISEYGGETHRYIGDEIVVTWPLKEAIRGARCVRCVFAIQDLIAARAPTYHAEFGVIPECRIGMHGGSVVASEVGDDKREIVYFGDTINTAARLEQMCKQLKRAFLVSGELLSRMSLSSDILTEELGTMELRGKQQQVRILSVSRAA